MSSLPLPVFHTPLSLLHNPPTEILSGSAIPYIESPERYRRILAALSASSALEVREEGWTRGDVITEELEEAVRRVHGEEYLAFLEEIYEEWVAEGGSKDAALPETFLRRDLLLEPEMDGRELSKGSAIARIGRFSFDLSAPITADTYLAALASARLALSALSHLISTPGLNGAFALCRPPGHHATSTLCGGYCFLSNAAIAARFYQSSLSPSSSSSPSGSAPKAKVAILDIDYHHGNGTSQIFYDDASVLYVSLHAAGDYPWYTGAVEEKGGPNARGANLNFPLPRGEATGDEEYLATLEEAVEAVKGFGAELLVVSLGVDTYIDDPLTDFCITLAAYPRMGRLIAGAGVEKVLFVMEGGYCLDAIGDCVKGVLEGFREGSTK
ncbi:hypothetical protein JCM8097_001122 [Rhodosporidiobolus ruineniae]